MPRTFAASDSTKLSLPPDVLFRAWIDCGADPRWWSRALRMKPLRLTDHIVGSRLEIRPRAGKPLECEVQHAAEPTGLQIGYRGAVYSGWGLWALRPCSNGTATHVTSEIRLEIVDRLIAFLSRCSDLATMHSEFMRTVFAGLRDFLLEDVESH